MTGETLGPQDGSSLAGFAEALAAVAAREEQRKRGQAGPGLDPHLDMVPAPLRRHLTLTLCRGERSHGPLARLDPSVQM